MSEINYQALREAAERAIPAMERLLMLPADDDLLSEQELKDYGVDIDALNAFKFLAGPETVLALLDERERNQQYIKSRDQENEDIALTVGKLRVELEAEKQRAKDLFMENARLKSGIAGLIHLGIRYADVDVMKIAGDAQLSTPCTDSIINSIATGILHGSEPVSQAYKLPPMSSNEVNDAAWKLHNMLTEHGPLNGCQFNNLKECFYEALKVAMRNYPVIPDSWISCSERMPAQDDWILIYSKHGEYMAGQVQGEYVELSDGTLSWLGNALFWMQLPEPPQEVNQ
ncbi:ead/Ea22-like family protein [Escherichia coli]|uniref:ead/Ea22-like family protein n=5 Tax=Escherichia coli TaxID=562 RepID=UPI00200CB1FA